MRFMLNGQTDRGPSRGRREPARGAARGRRAALDEGRLRARRVVRRVHGHRRRPRGRVVRPAGDTRRGPDVVTLEGLPPPWRGEWAGAFVASGASPVRLLLAGHRHEGRGAAAPGRVAHARGHRPLAGRQPVPLHRLRQDHRCDRTRGGGASHRSRAGGGAMAIASATATASANGAAGTRATPGPRRAAFVADMTVPGMLHGAVRFSDHPRAMVRRIDTTPRRRTRACSRVVTWRDVPGERIQGLLTPTGRCSSPRARRRATWVT